MPHSSGTKLDERLIAPFRAMSNWQAIADKAGELTRENDKLFMAADVEIKKHQAIASIAISKLFHAGGINQSVVEALTTHTVQEYDYTRMAVAPQYFRYHMNLIHIGALSMAMDNKPWDPIKRSRKTSKTYEDLLKPSSDVKVKSDDPQADRIIKLLKVGAVVASFTEAALEISSKKIESSAVVRDQDLSRSQSKPAAWVDLYSDEGFLPQPATFITLVQMNMPDTPQGRKLRKKLPAQIRKFITDTLSNT